MQCNDSTLSVHLYLHSSAPPKWVRHWLSVGQRWIPGWHFMNKSGRVEVELKMMGKSVRVWGQAPRRQFHMLCAALLSAVLALGVGTAQAQEAESHGRRELAENVGNETDDWTFSRAGFGTLGAVYHMSRAFSFVAINPKVTVQAPDR